MLISSKSVYDHDDPGGDGLPRTALAKHESSATPKATAMTALVRREQPFDSLNGN